MKTFEQQIATKLQSLDHVSYQTSAHMILSSRLNKDSCVARNMNHKSIYYRVVHSVSMQSFAVLCVCMIAFFGIRVWNADTSDTLVSDTFSFYSSDMLEYEQYLASGEDDDVLQIFYSASISNTGAIVDELLI